MFKLFRSKKRLYKRIDDLNGKLLIISAFYSNERKKTETLQKKLEMQNVIIQSLEQKIKKCRDPKNGRYIKKETQK